MNAQRGDRRIEAQQRFESGAADRIWPVLLDRLTDEEPHKRTEPLESRVMSRRAFRDGVLRDLRWLLNTTNGEATIDFAAAPDARRSVVNFGVDPLSGRLATSVNAPELEAAIRRAVIAFEPRILPQTLEVHVVVSQSSLELHNVLALEIRGQLWSIPYPLEMLLRSDIDLETGHVVLHDESHGA